MAGKMYRIDPASIEEAVLIHKILMLQEYVIINDKTIDHLANIIDEYTKTLECLSPKEAKRLFELCKQAMDELSTALDSFIGSKLRDKSVIHKYTLIITVLTSILKAYQLKFGRMVQGALYETLNELRVYELSNEKEEGD